MGSGLEFLTNNYGYQQVTTTVGNPLPLMVAADHAALAVVYTYKMDI